LAGFVATAGEGDSRTFFREGQGRGSSNTRDGAGNQNNGGAHRELLEGQLIGRSKINMDVRIISVKRSQSPQNWLNSGR
jgi:hypothetical protein